jgi:hypothetical protein
MIADWVATTRSRVERRLQDLGVLGLADHRILYAGGHLRTV